MRVGIVESPDAGLVTRAAQYRLFLYSGPASELAALDFVDSQVHEVLEAAELAGKDGKLWSLAVVVPTTEGEHLVWLSGLGSWRRCRNSVAGDQRDRFPSSGYDPSVVRDRRP